MFVFIRRVALFLLPVISILLAILFIPPSKKDNSYLACILDKDKIFASGDYGRLVFVGGSNLAFGLSCDTLAKIHNRKVINYGIQGGLGVYYQLNHIKNRLHKGDTLVIVPEYDQYVGDNIRGTGQALAKVVSLLGIQEVCKLDIRQIQRLAPFIVNASIEKIQLHCCNISKGERTYFNSKGDFIGHLNLSNRKADVIEKYYINDTISQSTIRILEEFQAYFSSRGVTVYFSFPPYPHSLYMRQQSIINNIEDRLRKSKINLIGRALNYVYPDFLFFEYPLHLNKMGRRIRTEDLLRDFKNKVCS